MKHYTVNDLTPEISAQINEKWNSLNNSQKWECVRDYTRGRAPEDNTEDKIKRAEWLFDCDPNFGFFILGNMDAADIYPLPLEEIDD